MQCRNHEVSRPQRRPLRRGDVVKACRSRCRSDCRHRVAASGGGTGCLPTIRSSPTLPRQSQSSLPPPQPLIRPRPPGPRQPVTLPGTESIGIRPHPHSSHPLPERRSDSQPDFATFHSAQTRQSASPAPTPCVFPCRNSSRKSSPRSDTCSLYPFPHPQRQRA